MKKVIIDLTESDIHEFENVIYNGRSFSWVFPTTDGEDIEIEFIATPDDTDNIEDFDIEKDR